MEDILDVYQRPYDPQRPVVGIDEQPEQLIKQTRQPLPAGPGQPERVDWQFTTKGARIKLKRLYPVIQT